MKTKTHSKSIDGNDRNKKKLEECWHHTNRQCVYRDDCDKIHKDTCTEFKKTGICEKEDCDLGHPDICNRLQRDGRCTLRSCYYLHPEVTRDTKNGRYRSNNYKNPKNFRFSKKLQECRTTRYNNNQMPRYNYRRASYRPNDHQSYPNNIKII